MKLIFIGNGEPDKDYSPLINPEDIVIRSNKIDHFDSGLIGDRTDIMTIAGNWSMRHHCYKGRISSRRMAHFKTCSSVWYIQKDVNSRRHKEILRRTGLMNHDIHYIDEGEKKDILSDQKYKTPTSAYLILKKIWKQNLFPEYEHHICCLSFYPKTAKRRHHDITKEAVILDRWVKEGKFKLL